MERNIMIRRLGMWIGGIALMVISLYLYLKNPLEVRYNLTLAILIWSIVILIAGYLLRNNRVYKQMKVIVNFIICIAIYLILAIYEYLLLSK